MEESHRHHSHLAGICPFDVISPEDSSWDKIIKNSESRWIAMGMGRWAGWSMPWAVMLHNRFGNAAMAELLIDLWERAYTNRGGGTLHDTNFNGLSVGLLGDNKVMQMDAGMGMVAAILDLFVYESQGVLFPLHGVPDSWTEFAVGNIRCPGGFLFSAGRKDGCDQITITATQNGMLKIRVPESPFPWKFENGTKITPELLSQYSMSAGAILILYRDYSKIDSID